VAVHRRRGSSTFSLDSRSTSPSSTLPHHTTPRNTPAGTVYDFRRLLQFHLLKPIMAQQWSPQVDKTRYCWAYTILSACLSVNYTGDDDPHLNCSRFRNVLRTVQCDRVMSNQNFVPMSLGVHSEQMCHTESEKRRKRVKSVRSYFKVIRQSRSWQRFIWHLAYKRFHYWNLFAIVCWRPYILYLKWVFH